METNDKINHLVNLLDSYAVNLRTGNPYIIKYVNCFRGDDIFSEKEIISFSDPTIELNDKEEIIIRENGGPRAIHLDNSRIEYIHARGGTVCEMIIIVTTPAYRYSICI